MKHITQYFDPVENALKKAVTSIGEMKQLLNNNQCPENYVEPVINGALGGYIQTILPNQRLTIGDIIQVLKQKVIDITDERVIKLLDFMLMKGTLQQVGDVIRLSMPNVRQPIDLGN